MKSWDAYHPHVVCSFPQPRCLRTADVTDWLSCLGRLGSLSSLSRCFYSPGCARLNIGCVVLLLHKMRTERYGALGTSAGTDGGLVGCVKEDDGLGGFPPWWFPLFLCRCLSSGLGWLPCDGMRWGGEWCYSTVLGSWQKIAGRGGQTER